MIASTEVLNYPTAKPKIGDVFEAPCNGLNAFNEHLYASSKCSRKDGMLMLRKNRSTNEANVFKPSCKMWSCPECSYWKVAEWKVKIMYGLDILQKEGEKFNFVTITLSGDATIRANSIEAWRKLWPRVYARHVRKCGKRHYVLLPERDKKYVAHMHAIIGSDVDERWWKDNCASSGSGYQATSNPMVGLARAANYVTKYLTKGVQEGDWPHSFRRIRTSHNWPVMPQVDKSDEYEYAVFNKIELVNKIRLLWKDNYNVFKDWGDSLVEWIDLT